MQSLDGLNTGFSHQARTHTHVTSVGILKDGYSMKVAAVRSSLAANELY